MKKRIKSFIRLGLLSLIFLFFSNRSIAQMDTMRTGSFIINMGVTPQTIANGLKPYGLIYELTQLDYVPVYWSINPTKSKDSADFIYNGDKYAGGTFIVPGEFIDSSIVARIAIWQAKGVVGVYTTSDIVVPIFDYISVFPRTVLDEDNAGLIEDYFNNAEIPTNWYRDGTPADLNACDDFYAWPHADPVWATHKNIYNFVVNEGGYIWAGCHAVSVIENLSNPGLPDTTLNFLTSLGLQCYSGGKCGPNPGSHGNYTDPIIFNNSYASDPVAQYMGITDGAQDNGSEDWYIPWPAPVSSQWRPTSKRLVTTSDGVSPGEGVKIVYGYAYGDSTNGQVMYEGGHSLDNGPEEDATAAQRAFFNFMFLAGINNRPEILGQISAVLVEGEDSTFSVSVIGGEGTPPFTFQWLSNCPGTFSNPNDSVTTFNHDSTGFRHRCRITVLVTDSCNRTNYASVSPITYPFNYAPVAVNSLDSTAEDYPITLFPLNYVTDPNPGDNHTVTIITPPANGSYGSQGDTIFEYTPNLAFSGLDSMQYEVCDDGFPSMCDTAWMFIQIMGDCDKDGIFDIYEGIGLDQDQDGVLNECDLDVDNDGITDTDEGLGDFDGDGVPDFKDADSDNDGIPDALEAAGYNIPADYDPSLGFLSGLDTDGDGLVDMYDMLPAVPYSGSSSNILNPDTDRDGLKNIYDLDSDRDGIPDAVEHNKGKLPANMDNNGQYPSAYAIIHDSYYDGLINGSDPKSGAPDNNPVYSDADPNPDYLDIDSDNDGITDNKEAQTTLGYIAPSGTDSDNDGLDNAYDMDASGFLIIPVNTDNYDKPDYLDLDSDNDFVKDTIEGHDPNSDGIPNTIASGLDSDGDGLDNAFDNVSGFTNSNNSTGSNAVLQDTDGDGIKDWRDQDDDEDGYLTIDEIPDFDPLNGIPDYLEVSPQPCAAGQTQTGPPTNGNGDAWTNPSGDVDNPGFTLGVPDGNGAKLKGGSGGGFVLVDLTDTILQGSTVTLIVSGDGIGKQAHVFGSFDGVTFFDTLIYTALVKEPTYETFIYTSNQPSGLRYIGMHRISGNMFWDAVSYSIPTCSPDADNDLIWNGVDKDDDNDGIPDSLETMFAPNINPDGDHDTDGILNYYDPTHPQCGGLNASGICKNFDTDEDGVPNHLDLDSDADGIPDSYEANNGVLPANMTPEGAYPSSYVRMNDTNGNGWANDVDPADGGTLLPRNNNDADINPDFLDIDSDNDGIVDNIEAQVTLGFVQPGFIDADNDGIDDAYDYDMFGVLPTMENTDGDAWPDYLDLDSDNDMVPDNVEGHDPDQDGIPNRAAGGFDIDFDGYDNGYDPDLFACSFNYFGQTPNGGCAALQDTDGDEIRDWRDEDDDSDGILTQDEDQDAYCTGGPGDGLYYNDFCEYGNPHPDYLFPVYINAIDDDKIILLGTTFTYIDVQQNDVAVFDITTSITDAPNHGAAIVSNGDSILYIPTFLYYGLDTLSYQICGTIPANELLFNRSAENYPFVGAGWVDLTTTTTWQRAAILAPPHGAFHFYAGVTDPVAELYQDVSIASFADQIDAGNKKLRLRGRVASGIEFPADQARIILEYRNGGGTLIGSYDSGPITSIGFWATVLDTSTVPIGARTARVRLISTQITGPSNDGFFDDISLSTLPETDCDTANVYIRIITTPVAVNDTVIMQQADTVSIPVLANDTDLDNNIDPSTVSVNALFPPSFGNIVTIDPVNGNMTYTPNPIYFGTDSLKYSVCDSTGLCSTAWIIIYIMAPPDANNDTISLPEDSVFTVNVLLNDSNGSGIIQVNTLAILIAPANGLASADTVTGSITYTPALNYNGADSLEYIICDDNGFCDSAWVMITLSPVDDPPIALDDNGNAPEDDTLGVYVLSNDSDPENNIDTLLTTIITPPINGTAIFNTTTYLIDYISALNFNGVDSFQYQICDLTALCDSAWVILTVSPVNDPPNAVNDTVYIEEDSTVVINILANDTDLENNINPANVTVVNGPFNGNSLVNPVNGEITYVPLTDYYGTDSLQYQVCDSSNDCDTAWVLIYLNPAPDYPDVLNPLDPMDSLFNDTVFVVINISTDTTICFPVYEPDGDTINFNSTPIYGPVTAGIITVPDVGLNDTCVNYAAPPIIGNDTISMLLCDNNGLCDTLTFIITIGGVEICNDSIDNDGDGLVDCADTSDCRPATPGVITVSNNTICDNTTGESYSIAPVAGATSYTWSVPAGATITSGQGTTSVTVNWGTTGGNVCVSANNAFCTGLPACTFITVNGPPANPPIILH